jgi:hypothetical protein
MCDVAKVDGLCPSRTEAKASRKKKQSVTASEAAIKIEIEESASAAVAATSATVVKSEVTLKDEKMASLDVPVQA